ncbi:iron-sulfur cluster insertion protein ErpA [Nitrospirillum iridis]|uniref:Iron-sulfur cluster insertion protein n=1 Tax=Nitrospirillum iridis TaxID=765888 RepID=A0A7X0EC57_9PROT|nr:iron-sulfur cluster insertion protein ErpA [Nitrospirillum iridis]MBB6251278.1 iron-sulfur cluster insertion protein [Nitrospirillum iridis]
MTVTDTTPTETFAPPPARAMSLSASAAKRVRKLAEMEGGPHFMMRLTVSGGGCSGFQYGFSFDDTTTDEDHVFEREGAKLVVDDTSLDLLAGAEVDFVEELAGSYFKINNPNASSSCGCGQSFSL